MPQLGVRQRAVALERDLLDAHAGTPHDIEVEDDAIVHGGARGVGHLLDHHVGLEEAFLHVVLLDPAACIGEHRVVHLLATRQVDLLVQLVRLVLAHAIELEAGEPRFLRDDDVQEDGMSADLGGVDAHVAEELLLPEVVDGLRDPFTGDLDLVPHAQSGEELHGIGINGLGAAHGDAADLVFLREAVIHRGDRAIGLCHRRCEGRREQEEKDRAAHISPG